MATKRKFKRKGVFLRSESKHAITKEMAELTLKEMHLRFMRYKRSEGLAPRSLNDYEEHFGYLLDFIGGGDLKRNEITADLILEYKYYMVHDKNLAPSTVNLRLRTLKAFLKWCYNEGFINEPIHEKLKKVREPEDKIRSLEPYEVKALLSVIDDEWYSEYRDKVIILTMLDTLMRISECLAVKRKNVDLRNNVIHLEASDTKARKARSLPISIKTAKLLAEYIQETEDFNNEYLFLTYDGRPLNHGTFRKRLAMYSHRAGLDKVVTPHMLRHTGSLLYLLNGGNIFSLQKILGHSTLEMTRKYVQFTESHLNEVHEDFSAVNSIFKVK
jgi:integrase/recombinase XerD